MWSPKHSGLFVPFFSITYDNVATEVYYHVYFVTTNSISRNMYLPSISKDVKNVLQSCFAYQAVTN